MSFLEIKPVLSRQMFQLAAGASILTRNYHFTEITTSTGVIFLCEMKAGSGPFLPLHYDHFSFQQH